MTGASTVAEPSSLIKYSVGFNSIIKEKKKK